MYPPVQMIPAVVEQRCLGPGRLVKWNYLTSLQTCFVPYCRYADIVLMEEIIVSNILTDWHDMCVKPFFDIALDCK